MSTALASQELSQSDIDQLHAEVERYLAAVDAFRAEGAGPAWANDEALPEGLLAPFVP